MRALLQTALFLFAIVSQIGSAHAITLAWNANPESDIAGYRIYTRSADAAIQVTEVSKVTTATLPDPAPGATNYYSVCAFNTSSLEGLASVEISYSSPAGSQNAAAGSYVGLITPDTGSVQGLFTMTVSSSGTTSGKLTLGSTNYSWTSDSFTNGTMTKSFSRTNLPNLVLTVRVSNVTGQVTGTVTDGTFSSGFISEAPLYTAGTNESPRKGSYTVVLSPPDATAPQGYGYATLSVSNVGAAQLAGTLADGTKFSYSTSVGSSGRLPIYCLLYSKAGSLVGEVSFRDTPGVSDADATLVWSKSAQVSSQLEFEAARYVFTSGTPVLAGLTDSGGKMRITLTNQGTANSIQNRLYTLNTNQTKFVAATSNPENLTLSLATTGLFSGSFVQSGVTIPVRGVLYQKGAGQGFGWFQRSDQSGRVSIIPSR